MLNIELISDLVNKLETNNKNDVLCLVCFFKIKKYKEKEYFKIEEVKELLILISIFEKNIDKIKDKNIVKELKQEIEEDLKGYRKDYKELVIIEKEEILIYIQNIYETIEIIQKQKEDEKQKQEKEKKLKEERKENHKKLNEYLLDNISLN